jgi:hypothetical protein
MNLSPSAQQLPPMASGTPQLHFERLRRPIRAIHWTCQKCQSHRNCITAPGNQPCLMSVLNWTTMLLCQSCHDKVFLSLANIILPMHYLQTQHTILDYITTGTHNKTHNANNNISYHVQTGTLMVRSPTEH